MTSRAPSEQAAEGSGLLSALQLSPRTECACQPLIPTRQGPPHHAPKEGDIPVPRPPITSHPRPVSTPPEPPPQSQRHCVPSHPHAPVRDVLPHVLIPTHLPHHQIPITSRIPLPSQPTPSLPFDNSFVPIRDIRGPLHRPNTVPYGRPVNSRGSREPLAAPPVPKTITQNPVGVPHAT